MSTSSLVRQSLFLAPLAAACVLASLVPASPVRAVETAAAPVAAQDSQPAVWTEKEVTFVYQGFTTRYSCDGLRDKVRSALIDLGAEKKGLKVQELGCSSGFGRPDPFPGVRVKMSVLQPVGTGASDDKQTPVAAHWKPVDLKLMNSFYPDSGECELVEQIKQKLVPLFSTRNVELKTSCIPHQVSATKPLLKMEVLALDQPSDAAATGNAAAAQAR